MRKIGSITPMWNQELFIKPHFEMLSKLDRNLVLMYDRPLPSYRKEHGYSTKKDLSEEILKKYFPHVEIVQAMYPPELDFGPGMYNEGLAQMQDMDVVFRIDPDMLWLDKDWNDLLTLIRKTDYDCYLMEFSKESINYYMTGDFEHGLKDAKEYDPLAISPKKLFKDKIPLEYPADNYAMVKLPDWICHHFRGWNKPKSTPNPEWVNSDYAKYALTNYGNQGGWFICPDEIKNKMESWMKELEEIKNEIH